MGAAAQPRRLLLYGDSLLRRACRPVEPGEAGLVDLVRDMKRLMKRHRGVGLAAPQVGDDRRVLLVQADPEHRRPPLVLVNPVLEETGGPRVPYNEGCLSFPGIYRYILRPQRTTVRYLDPDGAPRRLQDDGLAARIVQHEIDHLDGILMTDHLGWWTRQGVVMRMRLRRLHRGGEG